MAVIFDALIKNITVANMIKIKDISGPGELVGFSTGKLVGSYSDMFNGIMNIKYDSDTISVPTKYSGIDTIIQEKLKFNYGATMSFNPLDSGTLNIFVLYDDGEDIPNVKNIITNYYEYSLAPGNTIDIPIISSDVVVLYGIKFSARDNNLLFTLDTGLYLFKSKPTASIPDSLNMLSIPGDRLFITIENQSSNSQTGVLVVKYGIR